MMIAFGKPAADPTSDSIQARRAMAHNDFVVVVLSPQWDVLHSCAFVHRNRTRAGASPPEIFQRATGAFPYSYRRKRMECVRDGAFSRTSTCEVIYGKRESFRTVRRRQSRRAASHLRFLQQRRRGAQGASLVLQKRLRAGR